MILPPSSIKYIHTHSHILQSDTHTKCSTANFHASKDSLSQNHFVDLVIQRL